MHKFLKNIALGGMAAALACTSGLAAAQDDAVPAAPDATAPTAILNPDQEAAMQAWPADQQASFKTWPAETQAYFWSLTAERQKMFWALSDGDKVTLSNMPEPQRESTWAQLESRINPSEG